MAFLGRKKDPQKELESALRAGDYARASACYQAILQADPKNQQTRLRYADCLVSAGQKGGAVEQYVRVAQEMAQGGFLIKAIAVYKKIVKLDPSKEEYHRELAEMNKAREEGRDYGRPEPPAAPPPKKAPEKAEAPPPFGAAKAIPLSADPEAEALEVEATRHGAKVAPAAPEAAPPAAGTQEVVEEPEPEVAAPAAEAEPEVVEPAAEEAAFEMTEPPVAAAPEEEPEGIEFPMGEEEHEAAETVEQAAAEEPEGIQFSMGDEGPVAEEAEPAEEAAPPPPAPARATPERIPLFSAMSTDEFAEIVAALDSRTYQPDETVIKEGDEGNSLFIICQGEVSVRTRDPQGKEIELAKLADGDFFGEVAILTGKPRTATIVATKETELLELVRDKVEEIAQTHPRVWEILHEFYTERVNNTVDAMVEAALGGLMGPG